MDKIDRLLDAMEHLDNYTPTEIEAILHDPDVKEVFDLIDKTKSSLQTIETPDIEDEWRRFEKKQRTSRKLKMNWFISLFSRSVAASVTIAIAAFTAVAAIVGVGIHHIISNHEVTPEEIEVVSEPITIPVQSDTIRSVDADEAQAAEMIVFDDEPLEIILKKIAEYYDCKVAFNNEASKSLRLYFRWNQENTLEEVVERLDNFEQIHIVNKDRTIKID